MPTWTFTKKAGAPAGAINISVPAGNFTIDDSSNTSIVTTDTQAAGNLRDIPYLQQSSYTDPTTVHTTQNPFLYDGILSKRDLTSGAIVAFDGSELPAGGGGGITQAAADARYAAISHGASHGRGGADTLLNGVEIADTSTSQAAHTFIFGPRTTTSLAYPVATVQPKTAAKTAAFDIAPSSGAAAVANNGFAWIDICDGPVIDASGTWNQTTLRLGNGATVGGAQVGDLSTRKFGTAAAIPLALASDWNGTSNPQILLEPMTQTNPYMVLGYDGSDVLIGPLAAISNSATHGFLGLPTVAGAPTGTPNKYAAGRALAVFDTTNHKIWVYDGTWKGVVVA